jgi:hypothetical protein
MIISALRKSFCVFESHLSTFLSLLSVSCHLSLAVPNFVFWLDIHIPYDLLDLCRRGNFNAVSSNDGTTQKRTHKHLSSASHKTPLAKARNSSYAAFSTPSIHTPLTMPSSTKEISSSCRAESQQNISSLSSSVTFLAAIPPHPRQSRPSKPQMTSHDVVLLLEEALLLCEEVSKNMDNDDEPNC